MVIMVALVLIYFMQPKKKESYQQNVLLPLVEEKSWNEVIQDKSLEPSIKDSHADYITNTRQYSSGANFTSVADDNTSGIFTNFLGFSRPKYVDIDPTATQIPDVDHTVLKRNKHITFTNDYNL